jgi:hypothetical protein
MAMHADAADMASGTLLGGDEGAAIVAAARARIAARHVIDAARYAAIWVPGVW